MDMDGWMSGRTEGSVKNDQQPGPYTHQLPHFIAQAACAKKETASGWAKSINIASSQNRDEY
jgi:hypothetical protein